MTPTRRSLLQFAGLATASGSLLGDVPIAGARVVEASEELAGDGETDDGPALQTLIEETAAAGGGTVRLEATDDAYRIRSRVAPSTNGNPVAVVGSGMPVLDVTTDGGNANLVFGDAPNVRLENLTFSGQPAAGMSYTVTAGPGFRFRNLRFLGGQGGLDLRGTDVRGEYVYGTEQHDTENGWSGVLHVGDSRNVHVQHVYGAASDRGIEVDDGPTDVTIEKIWIEDIAPTMDTYSFTLDVHRHGDAADTDNVTFRDAALVNCQKGLTASNHSPAGSLSNVTFENVVQLDCATPRLGADDVTLRNVHVYADEQEPGNALAHSGGRLRVDGYTVHYAPDTYLRIAGGDRIPHRETVVDGLYGEPADGNAGDAIRVGSGTGLEGLTVRNVTIEPDLGAFARLESGATTDDGWGGTFRDCQADGEQSYVVSEENGPVYVTGGSATPSTDVSGVGSRFDAVSGVSPESVDSGVIVDGVATNEGDPTAGAGVWGDNGAILRANGAVVWNTTTDPHTPYAVDGNGNWLQWGGTTDGGSGGGFFDIF